MQLMPSHEYSFEYFFIVKFRPPFRNSFVRNEILIDLEPIPGGAREILKFTTAVHSTDFSPLHNCLVFAVTDGGKLHLRIVSFNFKK